MASIYKKFTTQDFATIPFNAHKQYNFDSASAADNRVTYFPTKHTSESISLYSTSSGPTGGDTINIIKYNQINHLFYDRFKSNPARSFDDSDYLKNHRTLYEKVNILSIPNGLAGYEIKPGSFYISSSQYQVIDDNYGNLIIQGTNPDNYPTDKRQNLFKLEPTKGFKMYDQSVFDGYAVFRFEEEAIAVDGSQLESKFYTRKFYRKGEKNPNASTHYSTADQIFDIDDSYHFNNLKYFNAQFTSSNLGDNFHRFPSLKLDYITGSYVMSPHNENFNFNREEDFAISFYMEPKTISGSISIGQELGGGKVFHLDNNYAYVASTIQKLDIAFPWGTGNLIGASDNTIGGGEANTALMKVDPFSFVNTSIGGPGLPNLGGYTDWWLANEIETRTLITNLIPLDPFLTKAAPLLGAVVLAPPPSTFQGLITSTEFNNGLFQNLLFLHDNTGANDFTWNDPYNVGNTDGSFNTQSTAKALTGVDDQAKAYFMVRKVALDQSTTTDKHYIISKSTTKTITPEATQGKSSPKSTRSKGNMQPKNIIAEPQFPFEIYMQSQSLHFDRSDGTEIISVNGLVTGSSGNILKSSHILCQKTGSTMELYFDGKKIGTGNDGNLKQVRNLANLYIGSKGTQSLPLKGKKSFSKERMFNGELTNINIYDKAFNQTEINNISESINASPYIGNIFYRSGFATITHPSYNKILSGSQGEGALNKLKFKGTHLIYEHEYQCTVNENEYNSTYNITNRKEQSSNSYELANFTTSSYFKPFVTTVGLYNEHNELLVVGKLGQPIRMSDETDTTFIVRWDT